MTKHKTKHENKLKANKGGKKYMTDISISCEVDLFLHYCFMLQMDNYFIKPFPWKQGNNTSLERCR